jgi:hypothetical protein
VAGVDVVDGYNEDKGGNEEETKYAAAKDPEQPERLARKVVGNENSSWSRSKVRWPLK